MPTSATVASTSCKNANQTKPQQSIWQRPLSSRNALQVQFQTFQPEWNATYLRREKKKVPNHQLTSFQPRTQPSWGGGGDTFHFSGVKFSRMTVRGGVCQISQGFWTLWPAAPAINWPLKRTGRLVTKSWP